MNTRIKQIRKSMKLTQVEFGEKLGVKGNTITNYETGLRVPTDAVIKSICREYRVNEEWLREGTGEMFVQYTRDEELAIKLGHILRDENESFRRAVLSAIINMDEKGCKVLEEFLNDIVKHNE